LPLVLLSDLCYNEEKKKGVVMNKSFILFKRFALALLCKEVSKGQNCESFFFFYFSYAFFFTKRIFRAIMKM